MKIASLALPPTASHRRRSVTFVPNIGQYADDRLGIATIVQQSSAVPGAKVQADSYSLYERPERAVAGTSAFTWTKLEGGEVYWTIIDDADATRDACTCDAGKFRNDCKHRSAIRELFAQGVFADLAEECR